MSANYLLWLVEDCNSMYKDKLLLLLKILEQNCVKKYNDNDVFFKYIKHWDAGYLLINVLYYKKDSDTDNCNNIEHNEYYLLSGSQNMLRLIDELYAIELLTNNSKIINNEFCEECKICLNKKNNMFYPDCHIDHYICTDCYLNMEICPFCKIEYNSINPNFYIGCE